MKRVVDVGVSLAGLIVMSPVLAVLAVLIRAETPGPVLFRQTRVGRNGDEFQILKFRSMVADAPRLGGHSTGPGDTRVTRVGSFIRKTSLDEVPQLVNVLRGDMSLVGPRPAVPAQAAEYPESAWNRRLSVQPGITGLAQVRGRSDVTFEQRLADDLEYVDHHGIVKDLQICLMTVRQLARGGSY